MKKKIYTLLALCIMVSISASSQTVKENIDKLHKDKNTADRAAKADVLMHKKMIYDSTQINSGTPKIKSNSAVVNKVKSCNHKYKKKTKKVF